MTKKLKRPAAFVAAAAMIFSMLLYLPSNAYTDFGLGITVSAEGETGTNDGTGDSTPADTNGGTGDSTPTDTNDGTGDTPADTNDGTGGTPADTDNGEDSTDDPAAVESESVMLSEESAVDITTSKPSGDGSEGNPYQIERDDELYWFAALVNGTLTDGTAQNTAACAKLTANITVNKGVLDANGNIASDTSDFTSWTPIGNFDNQYTGTFDGQGNTVSGLYFNNPSYFDGGRYAGLFGYIGNGGKVSKVGVVDSYFNGNDYVGGVCGSNYGTIESCYNTGIVSGSSYAGGVCGSNSGGTIDNCYNTGKVEASYQSVGGVCGTNSKSNNNNYKSTIKNCYNTGTVSGTNDHVGGVCGNNVETSTIENCHNTGVVSGKRRYVGGVCGKNKGTIKKCYNTGAVSGTGQYVGGLCGWNDSMAENCYNKGDVSGKDIYVGGLCGEVYQGTLQYSYNTGAVVSEKDSYVGIVCGYKASYGKINYCYYLGTAESDNEYDTTFKTEKQFKSGEVAFLLQGSQETDVWGQAIGTDDYPVLGGSKVYQTSPCVSYQNVKPTSTIDHNFSGADGICETCGYYQEATFNSSDNRYEISNAGQLYWFADKVNNDNENYGSKNAVLLGDITVNKNVLVNGVLNTSEIANFRSWTPIGQDDTKKYTGTFDGNGKIISGLYFNESKIYVGLFGYIGGTIKDVGVVDSYLCGTDHVGGVCGYNTGTIKNCYNTGSVTVTANTAHVGGVCGSNYNGITNCYNTGAVSATVRDAKVGGVCGYNFGNVSSSYITNCYNTGSVQGTGSNAFVGGVCGYNKDYYSSITNCYNTGSVKGTQSDAKVGGMCGYNEDGKITNCYNTGVVSGTSGYVGGVCGRDYQGKINNCYYLVDTAKGGINGADNEANNVVSKTEAQFNSGAVAYLLNGSKSTGDSKAPLAWYQNIDNEGAQDKYPVLENTHGIVYQCTECTGAYSNTEGEKGEHTDSGEYNEYGFGICSACEKENGTYQPATYSDSDGVYQIGNAGQLYWFAGLVNGTLNGVEQNKSANAVLTADIIVNSNLLSSIQTDESGAITNGETFRSWTPIGYGSNSYKGTFDGQNHTVSGLYFNDTNTSYVGLFGYVGKTDTIPGKVSNVGVVDSYFKGSDNIGGVCGCNNGTIENCYNAGTVNGTKDNVGGVCGQNRGGTIKNCYNTGAVSGTDQDVGGVCGYNNGTIKNCYNTGAVSGSSYVGGVSGLNHYGTIKNCYNTGAVEGLKDVGGVCGWNNNGGTITNCYYLDTTTSDSKAISKTTDDFKSGEVAYLLSQGENGSVWGQDLSTTTNYPVLGGAKVYKTAPCVSYSNENATKDHIDSNNNGECDVCGGFVDSIGSKVAGYSLSLDGNIGVNFFMELSDTLATDPNAYMLFKLPNGTTKKVLVSEATRGTTAYIFSCEVAAKEMTADITAQMFDGSDNGGTVYTYTVKDYADYIIAHPESYSAETVALVKAMLNYGAYSQTYFNYNTEKPANKDVEVTLPDITAADLSEDAANVNNTDACTFVSAYLTLKSETAINVKVKLAEGVETENVTVTVNGSSVNLSDCVKSGEYYVLTVDNIPANSLDTKYTFTVTYNEQTASLDFSALSYCYIMLNNPNASDNVKNLCKAIYAYNVAADAYTA